MMSSITLSTSCIIIFLHILSITFPFEDFKVVVTSRQRSRISHKDCFERVLTGDCPLSFNVAVSLHQQ